MRPASASYSTPDKEDSRSSGRLTATSLSGGGIAAKASQVFRRMDGDNNGTLDFSEMVQAMRELGALDGIPATEATRILRKEMKYADTDNDGLIDFQEFQGYFQTLARYQQDEARQQRLQGARKTVPAGYDRSQPLKDIFRTYCHLGKLHVLGAGSTSNVAQDTLRMTSRQFGRLCKDAGFLKPQGNLEAMVADVVFAQCKLAGERSISFKGFLEAIAMLAEGSGITYEHAAAQMCSRSAGEVRADSDALGKSATKATTPRGSVKRQSIVALAWKKQSASGDMYSGMESNGDITMGESPRRSTAGGRSGWAREESAPAKPASGMQKLLEQARADGAEAAAVDWQERERKLQECIAHLEAQLGKTKSPKDGSQPQQPYTNALFQAQDPKAPLSEAGIRVLADAVKSELGVWRTEVAEDLLAKLAAVELRWQANGNKDGSETVAVNKLRLQMLELEELVSRMVPTPSSPMSPFSGTTVSLDTAPAADFELAVQELETRSMQRQARVEAALMQIAAKVDQLEQKVKQGSTTSIWALEAILADSEA